MKTINFESPANIIFVLCLGVLLAMLSAYLFRSAETQLNGYAENTFIATPSVPVPLAQYPMTVASQHTQEKTRSLLGS